MKENFLSPALRNRLRDIITRCKMRLKDRLHLEEYIGKQLIIEGTYLYESSIILGKNEKTACVVNITCFYENEEFFIDHILTINKDVLKLEPGTKFKAYAKAFKYNKKEKYGLMIEDLIEVID